jgi:hypothetical protein
MNSKSFHTLPADWPLAKRSETAAKWDYAVKFDKRALIV